MGYYAASGGNFLPKFRDKLSVPSSGKTGGVAKGLQCFRCKIRLRLQAVVRISSDEEKPLGTA